MFRAVGAGAGSSNAETLWYQLKLLRVLDRHKNNMGSRFEHYSPLFFASSPPPCSPAPLLPSLPPRLPPSLSPCLSPSLPALLPPSLPSSHLPFIYPCFLSPEMPAYGCVQTPLPVSYVIHNRTAVVQEVELSIEPSDAFMYAGEKLVRSTGCFYVFPRLPLPPSPPPSPLSLSLVSMNT